MPILNLRLSMSFNVKSERKQMEAREKFRAIRKQRKLSLKQLASIAGSATSISDFENGKTMLSNDVLLELLSYMIVEVNEFFEWDYFYKSDFFTHVNHLQKAIADGNQEELFSLTQVFETLASSQGQYIYHIISLTIAIVLAKLQGKEPDQEIIAELTDYFFSIDYWTNLDIGLSGNVVSFLTADTLALLATDILKELNSEPRNNLDRIKYDTLLNCLSVLLSRKEKSLSQTLLNHLKQFSLPHYFAYEKLALLELEASFDYLWQDRSEAKRQHQQVLSAITLLFSAEEAKQWHEEFEKIVS